MMYPRKYSATRQLIHERTRVAARDEDALLQSLLSGPLNGYSMCRVLAREADPARQTAGPNRFQPDQTDTGDRMSPMKLRNEWGGKMKGDHLGIDPVVQEQSPPDEA